MFFFYSLQPQLFGNRSDQTALETQQGENDWTVYGVVQCGFKAVLMLEKTFLIMEAQRDCN